jgi:5-methyltetrahydropteroyltriglutamate--homocysteine methyltransferase
MPDARSRKIAPPFRADQVGSYLRPKRLLDAREKIGLAGRTGPGAAKPSPDQSAELREVENDCIREVVKLQEDAGLRAVTDGELRRSSWQHGITERIIGTELKTADVDGAVAFSSGLKSPIVRTTGKLKRGPGGLVLDDFKYVKSLTGHTVKVTVPAPMVLYRPERSATPIVDPNAYPDIDGFFADVVQLYRDEIADLAAAGCTYLQIDNTMTAVLCDPRHREVSRRGGIDPDQQVGRQGQLISAVTRDRPAGMTISMHLCRGNAAGAWIAEGGYEPVAETLFNAFDVDAFFLEYDSERAGDFAPLRFAPKDKTIVLGLVTTKTPGNDDKDTLKRRIDDAARYVPLDNLCLSPQCGFASGARGNPISIDDEKRKLALIVETAEEVWGSA